MGAYTTKQELIVTHIQEGSQLPLFYITSVGVMKLGGIPSAIALVVTIIAHSRADSKLEKVVQLIERRLEVDAIVRVKQREQSKLNTTRLDLRYNPVQLGLRQLL